MKVLQTIGSFGAKGGGTSTCTYDLLSSMHQTINGADVDLLTPAVADLADKMMGNGEEWIKIVENDYRTPLSISKNMVDFLRQSDYDIYHTNGMWMHVNHITCSVAREKKRPYVITPHGMLYPEALARSAWKKWPLRKLWFDGDIHDANCIHVTCQDEMTHLRAFGYNGPIALIGNPVDVPTYTAGLIESRNHKPEGLVQLGFLGRLHPRKQVEKIFLGMTLIQDGNIEIYIMGEGDDLYKEFLHNEVRRLGLVDRVHFLGFLNGREKFEQLSKMTALFVPSDMENFGMIIPEALIVGTPVMASLGTPWQALNEEKCGWWRDNSPESIAEVINEIKNISSDQLHAMGLRGREYILKNFAASNVAAQMYRLYRWLNGDSDKPDFVYEE